MRRALSFTPLAVSMIFLLGAAQLGGCSSIGSPAASSTDNDDLTVADVFDAFWTEKGGLATFGPPLEPAHDDNTLLRQTFLNVELVFETRATTPSQIYLAPFGRSLGLAEPPPPAPTKSGARYFKPTGHTLFTGFVQAFDQFGGETTIGDPISEVAFRDGLVVQYFENAGLYREPSAAPTEVHMLAFGLAARSGPDKSPPPGFQAVLPPATRPRPFAPFLDRYGGGGGFVVPPTNPPPAPAGGRAAEPARAAPCSS